MNQEGNNDDKEMRELKSMFHQDYTIMSEYRMLQTQHLPGVYVIPSYENPFLWFGVIFIRSGLYEGGIFRFTLELPDDFPSNEVPQVVFTSQIYHPAVDATSGILNLNEVFPQWNSKQNYVGQILKYVYYIFHNLQFKSPANMEAAAAFKNNRKVFVEKVKECVIASIDHVYDEPPTDDKHYITFQPYDPEVHESAKTLMLRPPDSTEGVPQGMSWVQPGSFQAFTKDESP